jgi:hypothetical protein
VQFFRSEQRIVFLTLDRSPEYPHVMGS